MGSTTARNAVSAVAQDNRCMSASLGAFSPRVTGSSVIASVFVGRLQASTYEMASDAHDKDKSQRGWQPDSARLHPIHPATVISNRQRSRFG